MKKGINLATRRKRVETLFRKAFVASVALFIAVVVISLGLIIYRLILKNSYDNLDKKELQLNQELLSIVDKKDKFIETKSRISDVRKLLIERAPVTERIETVSSVVPIDSTVGSLSGDDTLMQLSLESENLASLNELVEQKLIEIAKDKKKEIKKVEMKSFGLNPKSLKYSVTFSVTFN